MVFTRVCAWFIYHGYAYFSDSLKRLSRIRVVSKACALIQQMGVGKCFLSLFANLLLKKELATKFILCFKKIVGLETRTKGRIKMEEYASWRNRLIASDLKHPTKHALNGLWKVTKGGTWGLTRNTVNELVASVGMTEAQIIQHLNIAFKKRWVKASNVVHGMPITRLEDFTVIAYEVVVPQKRLTKPKQVKGSGLITLQAWEAQNGVLSLLLVSAWAQQHRLDLSQVSILIEEFRLEMMSKEKLYADFRLTFMTWLTKGYLSKKMEQIKISSAATSSNVRRSTPGVSI